MPNNSTQLQSNTLESKEFASHPFLDTSFPIQWSLLKPENVIPDITLALERAQQRVREFENLGSDRLKDTLELFEAITRELDEAWGKVAHLTSVCDAEAIRKSYNQMLPSITDFHSNLYLNKRVWSTLERYANSAAAKEIDVVKHRYLNEVLNDFKDSGAELSESRKKRLKQIEARLATLAQKFSENVLDSTNAWEYRVTDAKELDGIPAMVQEQFRQDAQRQCKGNEKPCWRLTLQAPCVTPVLQYANNASLRQKIWEAYMAIGSQGAYNNTPILSEMLALRHEKAVLLGYNSYADFILHRRMAGSGDKALAFIEEVHACASPDFKKDWNELLEFKAKHSKAAKGNLLPWDLAYWIEKRRRTTLDFDEEMLRPYFPMKRVVTGLFKLAEILFDIVIAEQPEVAVWEPSVKCYSVADKKGTLLGFFYADWYPRPTKRGGAWMGELVTAAGKPGRTNVGVICGNLTPPLDGKDACLTHGEVETIFHEFGHLLHHLLNRVPIASLAGPRVAWDFVELPSQIMENWCWETPSLAFISGHFESGKPLPQDLIEKKLAARNFMAAIPMLRQLGFSKMDLELHHHYPRYEGKIQDKTLDDFLSHLLEGYSPPWGETRPTIIRQFNHLFSDTNGYAAAYYSYHWAEVLDADAFTRFKMEGILNPAVGKAWVDTVLSQGNIQPPEVLFRNFLGRDAQINAFLERNGLKAKAATLSKGSSKP